MRGGLLRHKVQVQSKTEEADAHGQMIETWTTQGYAWANIVPESTVEVINGDRIDARRTHRIQIRWFQGMSPRHRLLHDGRVLNVRSVLNVQERNRDMELVAVEVV